jgi:hypothetical protein
VPAFVPVFVVVAVIEPGRQVHFQIALEFGDLLLAACRA